MLNEQSFSFNDGRVSVRLLSQEGDGEVTLTVDSGTGIAKVRLENEEDLKSFGLLIDFLLKMRSSGMV